MQLGCQRCSQLETLHSHKLPVPVQRQPLHKTQGKENEAIFRIQIALSSGNEAAHALPKANRIGFALTLVHSLWIVFKVTFLNAVGSACRFHLCPVKGWGKDVVAKTDSVFASVQQHVWTWLNLWYGGILSNACLVFIFFPWSTGASVPYV